MMTVRVRPDGSDRETLTPQDGISEVRAIPSADGEWLYFNRSEAGRTLIHRLRLSPSE